jgi:hypothetical protein
MSLQARPIRNLKGVREGDEFDLMHRAFGVSSGEELLERVKERWLGTELASVLGTKVHLGVPPRAELPVRLRPSKAHP